MEAPNEVASWSEVFLYPQMGLIVLVILLYFALENCLEFWPDSYLKELGHQGASLQASLLIFWLAFLIIFLPQISASVRRLHDIDRSGWWYWIVLIPIVGPIIFLVWTCMRGTSGDNEFGPDPLAETASVFD